VIAAWGAAFALISAVSLPTEGAVERLAPLGLTGGLAVFLVHAIPVIVGVVAVAIPMVVTVRARWIRLLYLAFCGGIAGYCLGYFLDAFAGLQPVLFGWAGPLREATGLDIIGWMMVALSLFYALLSQVIASFGSPALKAMSVDETDPACLEVRRNDRRTFARAAVGMVGQGLLLIGVVIANQAISPTPQALWIIGGIALLGLAFSLWSALRLWFGFDEMMRRVVMNAYAWSAILLTPLLFGWSLLEGLGLVPPLESYGVVMLVVAVQTIASFVLSFSMGGASQRVAHS
jgi:hypothetical protein